MTAVKQNKQRWIAFITGFLFVIITLIGIPQLAIAAEDEYLDVSFGGTFTPQKGYTTGGDENVAGGVINWRGDAAPVKLADGSVSLAGNTAGITYTARDSFSTGNTNTIDRGFIAELQYTRSAAPKQLDTIFSAMGNVFIRAEGDYLVYGFSVKTATGTWKDYKNQVALPTANEKHVLQVKYEGTDAAKLSVWVDGVQGSAAMAAVGEKAAIADGQDKVFGIGCEVNPDSSTATRGFAANYYRVRIAQPTAQWELLNLNELLRIDFAGGLNANTYSAVSAEVNQGTLTARVPQPTIQNSLAQLGGGASGFDFTAPSFTLGTDRATTGFIAELEFTPTQTRAMQTLFAAGGNIFLRYNQDEQLEFGISYQADGKWKNEKVTAPAPANAQHVVSVAYLPDTAGNSAQLVMRVDGKDIVPVEAAGIAALNNSIASKVSFANDIHPDALNRGFVGSLDEIRFARTNENFTTSDFKLNFVSETCDTSEVQPANSFAVGANECTELIKAKLSALRPTEKQADYLDWGQIGFVHFNVNTFTGNSWGHGDEDPALINAETIDTDQWAKTFADAGFKMMMVTVKHHDGFLLFDSRYNDDHDWPNTTTAKNGGPQDLFGEIVQSAHKYGLKVGVYYSPADSYMEKEGVFGNGSAKQERTIPTLVENDDRAARVASGELPTFTYEASDYGEYMLNQLYELLTDYGTIDEVWFDGAQGNTANPEYYDYAAFYDLIGKLQPHAVQANAAPDARWIGNEQGWARQTEWNPQGVDFDQYGKIALYPGQQAADGLLGSTESVISGVRSGAVTELQWYPGEVDAKNGPEWFNNSGKNGPNTPKAATELVKFYEQATGRNAQFLLNIPPYIDGQIPQGDVSIMRAYREELLRRYGKDLALGKDASVAESLNTDGNSAPKLTDGSKLSSDQAVGNTPVYAVNLGVPTTVDAVILGEDVRNAGQQVENFKVQGLNKSGQWQDLATGTTIGQQRNVRFASPATVSEIRVLITSARGPVRLARVEVYNSESEIQDGPRAYYLDPSATRAGDGSSIETPMTSIEQLHDVSLVPGSVILVKNGTQLTGDFAVFGYGTADEPITVTTYGEGPAPTVAFNDVKATSLEAALKELGKDTAGWKYQAKATEVPELRKYIPQDDMQIIAQSSQNAGDGMTANLLDGRLDTIWHSQWQPTKAAGPHWIVLDLGKNYEHLQSLDYLARAGSTNGTAKNYHVWLSDTADTFTGNEITGTLLNVPYVQRIDLQGTSGRYIKFQIDTDYSGGGFGSGAELNVEVKSTATQSPNPETPQSSEISQTNGNTGVVNDTAQVTIRNTNPKPAGDWEVGDEMQFQVSMVNVSKNRFSAKVRATNIELDLAECVGNTSWGNFKSIWEEQTAVSCNGSHIVTQADIDAGRFIPYVEFDKYDGCQDQTFNDDGQCQLPHWQGTKTPLDRFTADPIAIYPQHISAEMTLKVDAEKNYQIGDTVPVAISITIENLGNAKSIVGAKDSASAGDASNLSISENTKPCDHEDISHEEIGAVKACKALTYTITEADLERGEITPYLDVLVTDAIEGEGKVLQKARITARARIRHIWPAAEANQLEFDADVKLPASFDATYTNDFGKLIAQNDPNEGAYYRIPALAVASNGDLLAAYDYRPNMPADSPNPNSIVQRRSTDNGKTWGPETVVAQGVEGAEKVGYSDPSYVVDRESGTIYLFHVKSFDVGFSAGKTIKENGAVNETDRTKAQFAVSKSTDNGYTWSTEVITADVLDPNHYLDGFGFATSGAGIQIQRGEHAGRLVQQYSISNQLADGTWRNVGVSVYSDDGGKTWQAGKPTPVTTTAGQQVAFDENKVVELSEGTLLLNSRTTYGEGKNYRVIATSSDGGKTWKDVSIEKQLIDPGNNASIIRAFPNALPGTPKSQVLLFSNAKNDQHRVQGTNRINGSVTVSYDGGKTWDNANVWRFTDENEYVGYSTMAVQSDGKIGLLHELAGGGIQYLNFSLAQVMPVDKLAALQLTASGNYAGVNVIAGETFTSGAPQLVTHAGVKVSYSLANVPAGVVIDPHTGVISGSISQAGDVSLVVTAHITDGVESIDLPLTVQVSVAQADTPGSGSGSGTDASGSEDSTHTLSSSDGVASGQMSSAHLDGSAAVQTFNSEVVNNLAKTGAGLTGWLALTGLLVIVGVSLCTKQRLLRKN